MSARAGSLVLTCLLASCAAPEPEADLLPVDLAAPPSFSLDAGNVIAGAVATMVVSGGPPSTLIRFAVSTHGLGAGPCPPALAGQCLSVRPPVSLMAVSALTDQAGTATIDVAVPTTIAGVNLAFQGAYTTGGVGLSNPVARVVGGVGTVIRPGVDSDLDGFSPDQGDCADFDPRFNPRAPDAPGDGFDHNCDNTDGVDADGDGYDDLTDCDDSDPDVNPGARDVCNGRDDDCDGVVDLVASGPSCGRVDSFGGASPKADLLFVIDDSCSMAEEQGRITADSPELFDPLVAAGGDLHVGVITTDMGDTSKSGRLQSAMGRRYVDDGAWIDAWFQQAASLGTSGSPDERGHDAVVAALTAPLVYSVNDGFLRSDADLHVVVLSDEPDFSTSSRAQFVTWLPSLKSGGEAVQFHSLVGPPGGCPTGDPGLEYLSTSSDLGGIVGSVCDADYGPFLSRVADDVLAAAATGPFVLSEAADPATIAVSADIPGTGLVVLGSGLWSYDAATQAIRLIGVSLPPGGTLHVTYDM